MEAHIHELTASVAAIPTEGDGLGVTAAISVSTPEPAVALALAVLGVVGISACVVLTWGLLHQQGAELAPSEDDGGRLAAAA